MGFNSHTYILIFLPLVFFLYFILNKVNYNKLSQIFLIIASLVFYSYLEINNLFIISISILINYCGYLILRKKNATKFILTIFIIINLSLLGYYKYYNFIIENFFYIIKKNHTEKNLIIPLAISFFTFQQIAFLVETYKKNISKVDFINYTLFVVFFPQLIAGPIINFKDTYSQFSAKVKKTINIQNIRNGLILISFGLFKKIIIADYFSIIVDNSYSNVENLSFLSSWIATLSYTFQIYFDFSGYIDIALGSALLFNIKLPINFNSPYKSLNIKEFWRSWHISLSNFLKKYIYIPLGGNKINFTVTNINFLLTFLIGGFWHGAGWNFIVWGSLHGLALILLNIFKKTSIGINKFFAWFITFNFINITWIFFRVDSVNNAVVIIKKMFGFEQIILPIFIKNYFNLNFVKYGSAFLNSFDIKKTIFYLFICFVITIFLPNNNKFLDYNKKNYVFSLLAGFAFIISIIGMNKVTTFIYFNF